MANEEESTMIRFRCPACGEEITAMVKLKKKGLTTVSILHGEPKHVLVLYIDNRGVIRGYEVISEIIEIGTPFLKEFASAIGEKALAVLLYAALSEKKVFPEISDKELLRAFYALVQELGISDIVVNSAEKASLVFNPTTLKEPEINLSALVKIVKEGLEKSKSGKGFAIYLRMNIVRLKEALFKLKQKIEKNEHIDPRKFINEVKITREELLLIASVLKEKGYSVDKVLLPEFRIISVFK